MASIRSANRKRVRRAKAEHVITYPDQAEEKYQRALVGIVRRMRAQAEKVFAPVLAQYDMQESLKLDALSDVKMIETVEGIDLELYGAFERPGAVAAVREAAESTSAYNASQLGSILPIDPSHATDQAQINAFIEENVDLITRFSDHASNRMRTQIARAIANGTNGRELREIIQRTFQVSESRARLIARDQIGKLTGQLNEGRQRRAGVTQYEWVTVNDERVRGRKTKNGKIVGRGRHWQLHGRVFSWDKPPQVSTDGRHMHPGQDYQCRCQAVPVIDFDSIDDRPKEERPESVQSTPTAAPVRASTPARTPTRRVARPVRARNQPTPPEPAPTRPTAQRRPSGTTLVTQQQQIEIHHRILIHQRLRVIASDLQLPRATVKAVAKQLGFSNLT